MDYTLNSEWCLYFHDPNNCRWDIDSYVIVDRITTVNEWVQLFRVFAEGWNKGMFFLMRGDIKPLWEDDYNKNGGCVSFKLFKNEVKDCWFELTGKTICEQLISLSSSSHKISGVSISPKRTYCIVRIWTHDDSLKDSSLYNINIPAYRKMMYKSHSDNKDYKDE